MKKQVMMGWGALTLGIILTIVGCMGGNNGATPFKGTDQPAIAQTVNGFMAALLQGGSANPDRFFSARAQTSGEAASTLKTLLVYDFGTDIRNPNDQPASYAFQIRESVDITQLAENLAEVVAWYPDPNFPAYVLTFKLEKEQGTWYIDQIVFTLGKSAGGYEVAQYYPLRQNNWWAFVADDYVTQTPVRMIQLIPEVPEIIDGRRVFTLFERLDTHPFWMPPLMSTTGVTTTPVVGNRASAQQRASFIFGIGIADANRLSNEMGLFYYGPPTNSGITFNGGQPWKVLPSPVAIGFTGAASNTFSTIEPPATAFLDQRVTIEPLETFSTPVRDFSVLPMVVQTTTLASENRMQKSRYLLAQGVGIVGIQEFDPLDLNRVTRTLRLLEANVNGTLHGNPPVIASGTASATVTVKQAFSQTFALVTNSGTGPFTWTVSGNLPRGLTLTPSADTTSVVLSGTPSLAGVYPMLVQVTDKFGRSGAAQLDLTIVEVQPTTPSPIVAQTTTSVLPMTQGVFFSYPFQVVSGTGEAPFTWSTNSVLPANLTLAPTTGLLEGIPETTGTFMIGIQVTDALNRVATASVTLLVNPPIPPLQITTASLPETWMGDPYTQSLAATGGSGTYVWSVSPLLPSGMSFSEVGSISGTPGAVTHASFTFTVTDGLSSTSKELGLRVWGDIMVLASFTSPIREKVLVTFQPVVSADAANLEHYEFVSERASKIDSSVELWRSAVEATNALDGQIRQIELSVGSTIAFSPNLSLQVSGLVSSDGMAKMRPKVLPILNQPRFHKFLPWSDLPGLPAAGIPLRIRMPEEQAGKLYLVFSQGLYSLPIAQTTTTGKIGLDIGTALTAWLGNTVSGDDRFYDATMGFSDAATGNHDMLFAVSNNTTAGGAHLWVHELATGTVASYPIGGSLITDTNLSHNMDFFSPDSGQFIMTLSQGTRFHTVDANLPGYVSFSPTFADNIGGSIAAMDSFTGAGIDDNFQWMAYQDSANTQFVNRQVFSDGSISNDHVLPNFSVPALLSPNGDPRLGILSLRFLDETKDEFLMADARSNRVCQVEAAVLPRIKWSIQNVSPMDGPDTDVQGLLDNPFSVTMFKTDDDPGSGWVIVADDDGLQIFRQE